MGTRRPVLSGFREVIFPGAPPRGPASSSEAREGPRAGAGGLRLPRDRTLENGIRWWVRLAAGRVEHLAICGAPGAIGRNPGSGTCPGRALARVRGTEKRKSRPIAAAQVRITRRGKRDGGGCLEGSVIYAILSSSPARLYRVESWVSNGLVPPQLW